jgi:hypothetical protein
VHPTLGILAQFQAVSYAFTFFCSDGVPPPAPARVTQTVSPFLAKRENEYQMLNFSMIKVILKNKFIGGT